MTPAELYRLEKERRKERGFHFLTPRKPRKSQQNKTIYTHNYSPRPSRKKAA